METPTKEQLQAFMDHPEEIENVIEAFNDDTVEWLPYSIVIELKKHKLWWDDSIPQPDSAQFFFLGKEVFLDPEKTYATIDLQFNSKPIEVAFELLVGRKIFVEFTISLTDLKIEKSISVTQIMSLYMKGEVEYVVLRSLFSRSVTDMIIKQNID